VKKSVTKAHINDIFASLLCSISDLLSDQADNFLYDRIKDGMQVSTKASQQHIDRGEQGF
jgi:hypothetical protein